MDVEPPVDAVVVGAGFGGMYMLHRLRQIGRRAMVFEAADDVGGTWYWNRYPGARCDVQSMEYSYSFDDALQQEWKWTERFAAQPEILAYAQHVADRFDLRRDISFNTSIRSARFDESKNLWRVETGNNQVVHAQFLVLATGMLSSANTPHFDGIENFGGELYHTGKWPHHKVDFKDKRVAVIGTGSSGIQSIPIIAREAEHLTVFQRTPNYAVPAHNGPLDAGYEEQIKARYGEFRAANRRESSAFGSDAPRLEISALHVSPEQLRAEYERRWERGGLIFLRGYNDLLLNHDANETAAEFIREKIRATVADPAVAELLTPKSVVGCKRLCVDTNYFETYNRDNVTLVDISSTEVKFGEHAIVAGDLTIDLDMVVLATGFDAMTGSIAEINITGRGGQSINQKWEAGPLNYLGLTVNGFPNMFMITGPGSPSVLTNMIVSIEQHVEFISDAIESLESHELHLIEASPEAEDRWVSHVNAVADLTLFPTCNSWYLGANVPGKPRVFMPLPGFPSYVEECERIVRNGYEGFIRS